MATIEEIMALRAPNTSGVDTTKVVQALGAGLGTLPRTNAYGLSAKDATREAEAGQQARAQQWGQATDAIQMAMAQDKTLYDRAMAAHQRYLAERDASLKERVAAVDMAATQARMAIDGERLNAAKLEADILRNKVDGLRKLDGINIPIPNPNAGREYVDAQGNKQVEPEANPMPLSAALAAGIDVSRVLMGQPEGSMQERLAAQKAQVFEKMGAPKEDAILMSLYPIDKMLQGTTKVAEDAVKVARGNGIGAPNFGTVETGEVDKRGRPVTRPKTEEEFRREKLRQAMTTQFSMLSPEGLRWLEDRYGVDGSSLMLEESTDPLSGIDQDALGALLIQALQQ